MKKYLLVLLLVCAPVQSFALGTTSDVAARPRSAARAAETLRVRVVPDRSEVVAGDSMLVSYVLYATAPFGRVESDDRVEAKRTHVRRLRIDREATVGRTILDGKMYYTMVWAQYVVRPEKEGDIILPPCRFSATLLVYPAPRTPFEAFFGTKERPREVKVKARSEKLRIGVKPKPRRSNAEMRRGGGFA